MTVLAAASSTASALFVIVLLLTLVVLIIALGSRRGQLQRRPRRSSPTSTIVVGVIMLGGGGIATAIAVDNALNASRLTSLPECAAYATATSSCRIDATATVTRRYTTVTHGSRGGSTTHYWLDMTVTGAGSDGAGASAEMEAFGCWSAAEPGSTYSALLLGRVPIALTIGATQCRTTSHPGVTAQTAGIAAVVLGGLGAVFVALGVHARRALQRLGPFASSFSGQLR